MLSVIVTALQIAIVARITEGPGKPVGYDPEPARLGAAAMLLGIAELTAILAIRHRLSLASWIMWLGLAGGIVGSAAWLMGGAWFLLPGDGRLPAATLELAPVGLGVWAICAAAAAWKLRLWPAWLRVVGSIYGAAAMIQPGFPPAALIALLAGLPWWIGLGVELLRAPRSTGG